MNWYSKWLFFQSLVLCLLIVSCNLPSQQLAIVPTHTPTEPPRPRFTSTATSSPPVTLTLSNSLNDLVLAGQVYDAVEGPGQGIQGAIVEVRILCSSKRFRTSSEIDGHYNLLVSGSFLSSCDYVLLEVSAAGYRHFAIQPTVDKLRTKAQPEYDIALKPTPPTPTPSNELEAVVLRVVFESLGGQWFSPVEIDENDPTAVSYRINDGWDFAEIRRYSSTKEAGTIFAELCPENRRFHNLPACEVPSNPTYSPSSLHYSGRRARIWLSGVRIYKVMTLYHSTISGQASDPDYIAERLYQSAVDYNLIE